MVGRIPQFSQFSLLAGVLLVLWAGPGAAAAPFPVAMPSAGGASSSQSGQAAKESRWNVLGRSVEDRVVEYRQFGEGDEQVLVVGPLDGDATAAQGLVELLAIHLEQFPRRTEGVRVTLVRDPNPDGRLRHSLHNARGVRLDQNFPTRGWHKIPSGTRWPSGREPESEPETRLLVDLIDDVGPDRVLVLAGTYQQTELTYFGPAQEWAGEFAKAGGLRPQAARVASWQGSLALYAGEERKTPTLVLRVPAAMRPDQLWTAYKRPLLAALGGEAGDAKDPTKQAGAREAPKQTSATLATAKAKSQDAARRPEERGAPRVLTAEELESGGELVPVVRPNAPVARIKRDAEPAVRQPPPRVGMGPSPSQRPAQTPKPLLPHSTPYREAGRPYAAVPPAALFHPNAKGSGALVTTAPANVPTTLKKLDRLPPVDPQTSPPRILPQPIPLYPETGY